MSGLRQWPLSGHRRAAGFLAVTDVCGTPREARGLDVCLGEKVREEKGGREREGGRGNNVICPNRQLPLVYALYIRLGYLW